MDTFTDFAFYSGIYHGKLSEANYDAAVNQAYAEIISRTNGRALNSPDDMQNALKMCECELVDAVHSFSQVPDGVASINNDGFSISYTNGSDGATGKADTYKAICARYLQFPVNLMCGWL